MTGFETPRRLYVICEGRTEQRFRESVLQPYLFPIGDGIVHTVATGKKKGHHVHGITKYRPLKRYIENLTRQHVDCNLRFTTLIDFYRLPNDFPGRSNIARNKMDPTSYVIELETAFGNDIGDRRLIPHLQLHEYETMLFADPDQFAIAFENHDAQIQQLKRIAADHSSIEMINDGPETAPSMRICALIPEYYGRKTTAGVDIATMIGIPKIRSACPHFDQWLVKLEKIFWRTTGDEESPAPIGVPS